MLPSLSSPFSLPSVVWTGETAWSKKLLTSVLILVSFLASDSGLGDWSTGPAEEEAWSEKGGQHAPNSTSAGEDDLDYVVHMKGI